MRLWTHGDDITIEILKAADIVVETIFLLFSKELVEIQASGTRILTCIEPVDLLARLYPTLLIGAIGPRSSSPAHLASRIQARARAMSSAIVRARPARSSSP